MQRQQAGIREMQERQSRKQRGPFPRFLVLVVFSVLILDLLAVVSLLIMGVYSVMMSLAPVLIGLLAVIIPLLMWFFLFDALTEQKPPQTFLVSPSQTPSSLLPVILGSTSSVLLDTAGEIFHFDEFFLPSPEEFYGRAYERLTLIERISKRSSTAIVGEYRVGKSWLMQYLQQIAPTHPQLGPHVRIGRLSASSPYCRTLAGFVKQALEELNVSLNKFNSHGTSSMERLALAAGDMRRRGIIPVLCIDDFEALLGRPDFDKSFMEGLRAVAEDEGLVLITSSREPLHQVIEHIIGETSPLFNIMQQVVLKSFTEKEAQTFVNEKAEQAGLNQEEQEFFLQCAAVTQPDGRQGWPPLRLQLTGRLLLADKYSAREKQRIFYDINNLSYQLAFKTCLDEQYEAVQSD
jgi:hypothetical protein